MVIRSADGLGLGITDIQIDQIVADGKDIIAPLTDLRPRYKWKQRRMQHAESGEDQSRAGGGWSCKRRSWPRPRSRWCRLR